MEFKKIESKWPRLLVVGEAIPAYRAKQVLIRTDPWRFSANDKDWMKSVATIVRNLTGLTLLKEDTGWVDYKERLELMKRIRGIELQYLDNEQIVSSWIGGPHGWCDWDGNIGCATHNIGKWPAAEEVHAEWTAIAQAFPYLNLRSQLVEEEGKGGLCGQWTVNEGLVTYDPEPKEFIRPAEELTEDVFMNVISGHRERGCALKQIYDGIQMSLTG